MNLSVDLHWFNERGFVFVKIKSPHTAKYRPWALKVAIGFHDESRADAFERYLKSGSSHAFSARHLW